MRRTLLIGFFLTSAAFGQHYGGTVSSIPYSSSFGTGRNAPFPGRGTGHHGYYGGYPVYIGSYGYGYGYGFYGDDSYNPLLAQPDAAPAPPAASAPPVIINQYFGAPPAGPDQAPPPDDQSIRIYSQPGQPSAAQEPAPETRTYLIAYKDHSVYTALAYWIEDHTLHYVTTANTHNQADLSLIDIDFTRKLNSDRNMPFTVPGAK